MRSYLASLGQFCGRFLRVFWPWALFALLDLFDIYDEYISAYVPGVWEPWVMPMAQAAPYILLGAGAVLCAGWVYHQLRMQIPEHVEPDSPLYYAWAYLKDCSRWGCGKGAEQAIDELHQAAASGAIRIWGRYKTGNYTDENRPLTEIAREYWADHEFDPVRITYPPEESGSGAISNEMAIQGRGKDYEHLTTNRRQVLARWPRLPWWRRYKVTMKIVKVCNDGDRKTSKS